MHPIGIKTVLCLLLVYEGGHCYRLPSNIEPISYEIELVASLKKEDNYRVDGRESITIKCLEPTKNITLHVRHIHISKASIAGIDGNNDAIEVINTDYVMKNEFVVFTLKDTLQKGMMYRLNLTFLGSVHDKKLLGFYLSKYKNENGQEEVLAVTQFESHHARQAFPCFDEPMYKAKFKISLGREAGYRSISNMPLEKTEKINDRPGYYLDTFEESVKMSTYLVAFVISKFNFRESDRGNISFRIWSRRNAIGQTELASQIGPPLLEYFEKYFNIPYPLSKQDMVAVPDFSAGAMENWGLITYREESLLFDPNHTSTSYKFGMVNTVAHELAHQWFGNLVTMKWWTDLWLNEGFATYMATLATNYLYPEWNVEEENFARSVIRIRSVDSLRSSHPVRVPIDNPEDIGQIFDTISYDKGSALIQMMDRFLKVDSLRLGVSNYLREYAYKNAEQDDLWFALTKQAHKDGSLSKDMDIKMIMDTWTTQTGYPVVNVHRIDNNIYLTQERFLSDGSMDTDKCWYIPISYTTSSELNFNSTTPKLWMTCTSANESFTLTDNDTWYIININLTGLYIVNYDDRNWENLTRILNSDNHTMIPQLNKVQILTDAFSLAKASKIKYNIPLNIFSYLENEHLYLPWKRGVETIENLENLLKGTKANNAFKRKMMKIVEPAYLKHGGFAEKGSIQEIKFQTMINSQACWYEVVNCLCEAKSIFEAWINSSKNTLPKESRSTILCYGIADSDNSKWDLLLEHYLNATAETDKMEYLRGLACTKSKENIERLLDMMMDSKKVRVQNAASVFSAIAGREQGYPLAQQYFYKNFQSIIDMYEKTERRRLGIYISAISSRITTTEGFQKIKQLMDSKMSYLKEASHSIRRTMEAIQNNLEWHKNNYLSLEQLLNEQK